ncbi:hypothetical protein QR680_006938 [Steinernema hermaphroditum]|uniref:Uncharacterized protein n=1 Tax=Steinernema hermaphroditum TaxID=289476 RepID=A0AA39HX15_9BILA|nr:hypothetical protein QR680_006938 [Steinernema hermaphroditum]
MQKLSSLEERFDRLATEQRHVEGDRDRPQQRDSRRPSMPLQDESDGPIDLFALAKLASPRSSRRTSVASATTTHSRSGSRPQNSRGATPAPRCERRPNRPAHPRVRQSLSRSVGASVEEHPAQRRGHRPAVQAAPPPDVSTNATQQRSRRQSPSPAVPVQQRGRRPGRAAPVSASTVSASRTPQAITPSPWATSQGTLEPHNEAPPEPSSSSSRGLRAYINLVPLDQLIHGYTPESQTASPSTATAFPRRQQSSLSSTVHNDQMKNAPKSQKEVAGLPQSSTSVRPISSDTSVPLAAKSALWSRTCSVPTNVSSVNTAIQREDNGQPPAIKEEIQIAENQESARPRSPSPPYGRILMAALDGAILQEVGGLVTPAAQAIVSPSLTASGRPRRACSRDMTGIYSLMVGKEPLKRKKKSSRCARPKKAARISDDILSFI